MEQYIIDFLKENKIEYEIVDGVIYTKGEPLPPNEPSKTDILLAELSEYVLELEVQNIETSLIANSNAEYVLDLDTRITNIETQKPN